MGKKRAVELGLCLIAGRHNFTSVSEIAFHYRWAMAAPRIEKWNLGRKKLQFHFWGASKTHNLEWLIFVRLLVALLCCCFLFFVGFKSYSVWTCEVSRLKSKKARAIIAVKSNSLHSRTEKCIFHSQPIRRDQITFQLNRRVLCRFTRLLEFAGKRDTIKHTEQISRKWINYTPKKHKSELN